MDRRIRLIREIRFLILIFILGLFVSGITAFPIETQLAIAHRAIEQYQIHTVLSGWLDRVYFGVKQTNEHYPFIAYGTDWLAFAHLIIAVLFIGPLRDPVRNIWVIEFGMIACIAIFPLAIIAGAVREIPVYWRMIDCSFGVIGGTVLWICYRKILLLSQV